MDIDVLSCTSAGTDAADGANADQVCRVDVPFRVFSPSYYRNLTQLYTRIGIAFERADYNSTYCTLDGEKQQPFFTYCNVHLFGQSIPVLYGRHLWSWSFVTLMRDAYHFFKKAPRDLHEGKLDAMSFGEYLESEHFSDIFAQQVLLPAMSVMCTCTYDSMRAYPADLVVYCLTTRMGDGVRRVVGGNSEIARRLAQHCKDVRCGTAIKSVRSAPDGKHVVVEDVSGSTSTFDHVIMSTQANQALRLVTDASEGERAALGAFDYESSRVIVHSDPACMPTDVSTWASVNFFVDAGKDMPMATIWLNGVQRGLENARNVFQTWNPLVEPAKDTILSEATFQRPVMNARACQGIEDLRKVQGLRNIWFCGSYARYAVPLLENGLSSAIEVCGRLGVDCPWTPLYHEDHPPPRKRRFLSHIERTAKAVLIAGTFYGLHRIAGAK